MTRTLLVWIYVLVTGPRLTGRQPRSRSLCRSH
jgi:hypothetical protein